MPDLEKSLKETFDKLKFTLESVRNSNGTLEIKLSNKTTRKNALTEEECKSILEKHPAFEAMFVELHNDAYSWRLFYTTVTD